MLHEEKEGSMATQDDRLSTVEQSVVVLRKGLADIHHNETILLGVMAEQGGFCKFRQNDRRAALSCRLRSKTVSSGSGAA